MSETANVCLELSGMGHQNSQIIAHRYDLHARLGKGGMGEVYRATDRLTGETVALKRVTAPTENLQFTSHDFGGDSVAFRLALAQEFRMLASLRHPQVINVLDYGFDETGSPFFTMDLLHDARPLNDPRLVESLEDKASLLFQTLQAVAYLHRRGVIHRDLKPANVLVSAGQVKVLDFGLAIMHGQTEPDSSSTVGTLAYIAPEVLQGERARAAADLYAIGVMAYEILTGRHPFDLSNMTVLLQQVLYEMPDMMILEHLVPRPPDEQETPSLDKIIVKLLAKSSVDRYQDAYVVIEDLSNVLGQAAPQESAAIRESFLQAAHFVGRDQEMALLEAALDAAIAGRGEAWLIAGESGVGKTRLLDELRIRALVNGVIVLRGQTNPDGGLPYQLWREPLRRMLLSTELDDLDAGILKDIVPDIEQLQRRPIPDAALLESTSYQQRLVGTIISLFQRQTEPILIMLEDLQWASESLEIIRLFNGMIADLPILLVATFRPEEAPNLPDALPEMKFMQLERLRPESIAALSVSMLGTGGSQPELLDLLQRETEGNVYFLVEVVRALAEDAGRLEYVGMKTLPRHVFTGGITTIIERRLAKIPAHSRELLQFAAAAGRELELPLLDHVRGEMELESWLTTCANCAVIEIQDSKWQFVHEKLRQAVLQELSAQETAALHRKVAEAMEAVAPGNIEQAAILAQHWRYANDAGKELEYVRQAGRYALHISMLDEAQAHFSRALALLADGVLPEQETSQARVDVLLKLVETLEFKGEYDTAKVYCEQGLRLCREIEDQSGEAQALHLLANLHWRKGNYPAATAQCLASLQLSETIGDQRTTSRALNRLGMVYLEQGKYQEAEEHFEKSLALANALDDVDGRAVASNNRGLVAYTQGNYTLAAQHFEEFLEICKDSGQRGRMASALINLGGVAGMQGDLDQASRHFEESLKLARTIGDRREIALALDNLGFVAVLQSEFAQATGYFEESLAIARAIGNRHGVAKTLPNLAEAALGRGNHDEAIDLYYQALQAAHEIDALPIVMESLLGLAKILPDHRRAITYLRLIANHDAASKQLRQSASTVLDELKEKVEEDDYEAALEEGEVLTLTDVVERALQAYRQ